MKCPACGHENRSGRRFCAECGAQLSLHCPACKAANKPGEKYCGECGTALVGVPQSSSPLTANNVTTNNLLRTPQSYTPKHLAERILAEQAAFEARGAPEGERKTITALFADIKGSMELLEDLDPEDARRLIDPALQIMMDAVHRYEGYVAQSTGDGIFALFGAPIAHEDHARRACYAALRMQEEMHRYAEKLRLENGVSLQARVGLNTGVVVLRSIRTDDLHADYVPVGHSVSLAARMESLAAPGSIVASEHTRKLIEGYFRLKALGPTKVKGVSDLVEIYEVAGVGPLRTRMEVAVRRGLVRFVGRHDEMEQLRRAWESAKGGHGQIVAVMGEAGVGKSRLFYEFKVPLQSQGLVLEAFSVSHGKAYACLPLVDLLKSYFGIGLEDDERTRREKVAGRVIMLDRKLEDALPYLFSLLGVTDPTSSLAQMDVQIRRQRTMEAVKRVLVRETLNQPMVVIFEDLHWIDEETQAFLEVLSEAVATARLLLLVNYRPEYRHGWGSKTYYTQLRLDPLGQEEARELLAALLGDGAAEGLASLRQLILAKTEGNPFFMEEVVQTLAEEGVLLGDLGNYRLEKPPTELHIPATVQGVLAARIDRLPANEKEFLQILSVIGKEFSLGLLRKATGHSEGELYHLLSHVRAGEFVYEQPAFPEPEYTFKHALTQEVAYQSVLLEKRKLLHERTAQAIEEMYESHLDEHYAELAHHYSRTDNSRKAVEYLHLTGQQAIERSAYEEAIRQLSKGLELLQTQPETPERNRQELLLQVALGPALRVTKGFTASEVESTYLRARQLCERIGPAPQLFDVLWELCIYYSVRGESEAAHDQAQQLLGFAQRAQDPALVLRAHGPLGATLLWRGELIQARMHLNKVFDLAHLQQYRPQTLSDQELFRLIINRGLQSFILWCLGYADQAMMRSRETVTLAQQVPHPAALATAYQLEGALYEFLGDAQVVRERAEALIALASKHGFASLLALGTVLRACALTEQGELEEGITQMRLVLDALRAAGAMLTVPHFLGVLSNAYGKWGRAEEGLTVITEAVDVMNKTGQLFYESLLYRIRGELLLSLSAENQAEPEDCFRRAIDVARRKNAKSLELRASTSLSRLWQNQGRKDEARPLLAEIYGWFTEGFDTRDLKEAKALLDELA